MGWVKKLSKLMYTGKDSKDTSVQMSNNVKNVLQFFQKTITGLNWCHLL